jgi:hypothetical protein
MQKREQLVAQLRHNGNLNVLAYDADFRDRLAVELLRTIVSASTSEGVIVLRIHEIRDAIADSLAEILALEGTIPNKRLIEGHAQRVRQMLAHHRRNPAVAKFKARTVRFDVGSGGRS